MGRTNWAGLSLFLIFSAAGQATLLTNGGFESGLSGWTVGGGNPQNPVAYQNDPVVPPHSGDWALDLGPSGVPGANFGWAEQTVAVTGGFYLLEFWHRIEEGIGYQTSPFRVELSGSGSLSADLTSDPTYAYYSALVFASAGSLTVRFTDGQFATGYSTVIDDVSLTPSAAPVPEPSSLLLAGIGAAGLLAWKRRRPS